MITGPWPMTPSKTRYEIPLKRPFLTPLLTWCPKEAIIAALAWMLENWAELVGITGVGLPDSTKPN